MSTLSNQHSAGAGAGAHAEAGLMPVNATVASWTSAPHRPGPPWPLTAMLLPSGMDSNRGGLRSYHVLKLILM